MTELMKRYEKYIGQRVNWSANPIGYIHWLESQVLNGKTIEKFQEIIRNQCDEISALKAQLTWRPVSEKPEEGERVFLKKGTNICNAYFIDGCFMDLNHGYEIMSEGASWLPIPTAPEGE